MKKAGSYSRAGTPGNQRKSFPRLPPSGFFYVNMQWIAASEKNAATLEKCLRKAAEQLRARIPSAQYSTPVLGLIFFLFVDVRFAMRRAALKKQTASLAACAFINRSHEHSINRPENSDHVGGLCA